MHNTQRAQREREGGRGRENIDVKMQACNDVWGDNWSDRQEVAQNCGLAATAASSVAQTHRHHKVSQRWWWWWWLLPMGNGHCAVVVAQKLGRLCVCVCGVVVGGVLWVWCV